MPPARDKIKTVKHNSSHHPALSENNYLVGVTVFYLAIFKDVYIY